MRVDQDVIETLDRATTEGNRLTLVGQLDRKLYERTAKALDAAGGKWNRKAGAHLFDGDAAEAIEPILLTGQIVSAKSEFDAFYTPADLARRVAALANLRPMDTVLEPSAGDGALVRASIGDARVVYAIELRPSAVQQLNESFDDHPYVHVQHADFLSVAPVDYPTFDRVAMNPPFSRQQDIRHIMHAARFVKPGGRLVAIASTSVGFRDNALSRDFRDWLSDHGGSIEPLPEGSFKASGTGVNTVIVTVDL